MSGKGIRIEGLRKRYGQGDTAVDALKDVNMVVEPGEVIGLIGPSGSGKSTLLKCLGAVIDPTAGRMTLGDETIYDNGWKVRDLRALRRDKIGFVFQAPYLIPFLDVTDNVALLPMLAGVANAESRQRGIGAAHGAGCAAPGSGHARAAFRRRAAACGYRAWLGESPAGDSGRRAYGATR
jgi:putative ABC transport system ATP-binding protein